MITSTRTGVIVGACKRGLGLSSIAFDKSAATRIPDLTSLRAEYLGSFVLLPGPWVTFVQSVSMDKFVCMKVGEGTMVLPLLSYLNV